MFTIPSMIKAASIRTLTKSSRSIVLLQLQHYRTVATPMH